MRVGKVFTGSALANFILVIFTGAPNPYSWCRAAIVSALLVRRILGRLAPVWFGEKLRLPATLGYRWDQEHRAYALETERIDGRHVALRHPLSGERDDELEELRRRVLPRLQEKLRRAGFDGLLWQAGLGNPVALNNFLVEDNKAGHRRWVWIDLESGVPALFPVNPLKLLAWYLPRSFAHRQPLFDHVDIGKLARYLEWSRRSLESRLGAEEFEALCADVVRLRRSERAWRRLPRLRRGITHARMKGMISASKARWFRKHSLWWSMWILRRSLADALHAAREGIERAIRRIAHFPVRTALRLFRRFATSHQYRARLARLLILQRIRLWMHRRQLTVEEATYYRGMQKKESASTYLADFAVHLALKPLAKLTTYVIVPVGILWSSGAFTEDAVLFLVSMMLAGPTYRTAYTLGRVILAFGRGEERPWVALLTGVMPIVGNGAFLMQFLYASRDGAQRPLPQFMLCDAGAWLGTRVPIWGGPDTGAEHLGNRVAARASGV